MAAEKALEEARIAAEIEAENARIAAEKEAENVIIAAEIKANEEARIFAEKEAEEIRLALYLEAERDRQKKTTAKKRTWFSIPTKLYIIKYPLLFFLALFLYGNYLFYKNPT